MTTEDKVLEAFMSIDFESITKHPNILIAANFWDAERYNAARNCYRFMRYIDDLIDDHKAANCRIDEADRERFTGDVGKWLTMIMDRSASSPFQHELVNTVEKFRIPHWPLEAFARSMIYDIYNDGFDSMQTFIEYSQGASVAPASIFVHLAGLRETDGVYYDPPFDVRSTATPCAIFSYLVHIMRDFTKDQMDNLNYFAGDIMAKNGLTPQMLTEIARGAAIPSGFREMMRQYYLLADKYRIETMKVIESISPLLTPRYRLSFEIIFELYLMVFERIDIEHGSFTTAELNPTPAEIRERVRQVIDRQ